MTHIARFIRVAAPIDAVFAFLADYRNIPRLQPHFDRVRPLTEATTGLGAMLELHGSLHGVRLTAHLEIMAFDPPHLLVSDSTGAVRSRSTWRLSELPADGGHPQTRAGLTLDYDLTVPAVGRLIGGLLHHDVEAQSVESLKRLKLILEGHPLPPAG